MAYSFQTFVFNEIFTSTAANQMEVNIRDHVHGRNNVVPSGLNFAQTNKTTTYSVSGTSDNGELFRAGTAGTSNMDLDLPDASTAGDTFAVSALNDNDLQAGETGYVDLDPGGSDIVTEAGFVTWPLAPGEAGSMISSNGIWYPFGFGALHPLGLATILDNTNLIYVPQGFSVYLLLVERVSRTTSAGAFELQTRIAGGSFDTGSVLAMGDAPTGAGYKAAVLLFNLDKPDGAAKPVGTLMGGVDNGGALSPSTAECGASSATVVDAVGMRPSTGTLNGGRMLLFGVGRRVSL